MDAHHTVNPTFRKALEEFVHYIREQVCAGRVTAPWSGENYVNRGETILKKLQKDSEGGVQYLFEYGTLMSRQSASYMLEKTEMPCSGKNQRELAEKVELEEYLCHNLY